jgi:hypothetical protein
VNRTWQVVLIASTLGMQAVHEAGHVLLAWDGGETVHRVTLHPLTVSRTDATHDKHPLLVVWGGPVPGTALPLGALGLTGLLRVSWGFVPRFFAGFCLVANGAYLGAGSLAGVGDAADLLRHGSPRWLPIAFGLVTLPLGLRLWHGLGPAFGLGVSGGRVSRGAALGTAAALTVLELFAGRRG